MADVLDYMVKVYAFLVKVGRRDLNTLPADYPIPVAEYLASQVEPQPQ
ncbi:hypothetical protein GJ688_02515 [Heliobacillus mobilis]|uniref:Uncharacterized protein n=1 Tax=Heliobacterium mobile TaxID=28064 RepID=A0A6I3SBP2_HELMO|nr:CD1375 family protein [Heliobacterium mobile]MTV47857.1 hypothetical protein [Heliobacterium mobile]